MKQPLLFLRNCMIDGLFEEKETEQYYDETTKTFLADGISSALARYAPIRMLTEISVKNAAVRYLRSN